MVNHPKRNRENGNPVLAGRKRLGKGKGVVPSRRCIYVGLGLAAILFIIVIATAVIVGTGKMK